jgi:hypothetical protein
MDIPPIPQLGRRPISAAVRVLSVTAQTESIQVIFILPTQLK